MEKLILRGVMWGADKIPDSFFDKVPGGYYRAKDQQQQAAKRHSRDSSRRHHRDSSRRRRHSQDDRRRRHGRDEDDEEDEDLGYRSDGHRARHHDSRKSRVDGEDDYDPINNRPRRQRSRIMRDDYDDDEQQDGYGYRDGYGRDSRYDSPRMSGRAPYPEQARYPYREPMEPPPMGPGVSLAAGAGAGMGAAAAAYNSGGPSPSPIPSQQSTSVNNGSIEGGYVPYANIYGSPVRASNARWSSPPSADGSIKPNSMNQIAAPVAKQPYHQNPFAQEAPLGSQPSYLPDPYYNARQYEERGYDRYDAYGRTPDRRAPDHDGRHGRRSDSRDSYDSRSDDDRRRARSRRRADDDNYDDGRPKSQGRGKSGIRDAFDTSQRGLGYSAVGALAGGLVGSEIGKGKVPAAVGAAVGALGANAFQASERKKAESRHENWQQDGTYARGEAKRSQRELTEKESRENLEQ